MKTFCQFEDGRMEGRSAVRDSGEEGFMLVAVVVMVAILLITLSVAAPVVARQLRRDKEVESEHRMEQYVRAIQLYQRKFPGQYPASIKALEGTNNIRFLRHVYVDPLTGKADYKLIHQGEQKTKIHVFFGQELDGLAANLGSASGLQSTTGNGTAPTSATTVSAGSALSSGFTDATIGTNSPGTSGAQGTAASTSGTNGTSAFGDGTGGVIVGVGTAKSGESISEPNGQGTYESWEFWYDPRIEMLKKQVSITGGGISSQSASSAGIGLDGLPNSGASGTGGIGGSTSTSNPSGPQTGNGSNPGTSNPNSSTPNPF